MSSLDRTLRADILRFNLDEEEQNATHPDTLARDGRSSRTLLKEGPLRVTLIVLGPGGGIPSHEAPGPITIQPIRGQVDIEVSGATHSVGPNELLAIDGAVSHSIAAKNGASFLLTVTHPPAV